MGGGGGGGGESYNRISLSFLSIWGCFSALRKVDLRQIFLTILNFGYLKMV